jgi:membrane fusion protein, multidrug efflux system
VLAIGELFPVAGGRVTDREQSPVAREGWITGATGRSTGHRTDDATVQAVLTPLSVQVARRIGAVPVGDFQVVHASELLAEIDDARFRAQLAQADANVAAAEAAIANLQAQETLQTANIAAAAAQLDGNRARALRNRLKADRQHKLLGTRIARTEQASGCSGQTIRRTGAAVGRRSSGGEPATWSTHRRSSLPRT